MLKLTLWRLLAPLAIILGISLHSFAQSTATETASEAPQVQTPAPGAINFVVKSPNERMEMTVHSSRIITIGQKIPQAQVNNPEILDLTPLSPTQVQVSAKTTGVTQINLWGEDQKVYTIDVIVYGDASELKMMLKAQFPKAALTVTPVGNSVLISGYVDKAVYIDRIIRIAEEYYPKVINNMTVGGVQTVLLHVKVMEVSRTKLRHLGFDWAKMTGGNTVVSGVSGLVSDYLPDKVVGPYGGGMANRLASPSTFGFNVINGSSGFFGVLNALRQDNLMKITAEPTLVAESGRAASFNSGGEIPVPTPQSLGTLSIDWKTYGTRVDFVPIVLGNGKIRLEVRPYISELDYSNSITISGSTMPGIRSRTADTAVEMMAGQTLAIAGLVQSRTESYNHGLPWISELPYLGAAFRNVENTTNEVESLIMVTPELVDAMDANEVPQCGPGMSTTDPTDWELFMKGHLEVPNCCPAGEPCTHNKGDENGSPTPEPEEGMIGPEQIQTPPASGTTKGSSNQSKKMPGLVAPTNVASRTGSGSNPNSRYNSSKQNGTSDTASSGKSNSPPGFIGPVGYDVVK